MESYEYIERVPTPTGVKERMRNKYMENRKNISIVTDTYKKLIEIRKDMELKSLTDAINELIAIKEKVVTGKSFQCKKCGQNVEIYPGTKPEKIGLIHSHVANTDCPGCIKMSYTLKDKAYGTTESNDKNRAQTDTKDEYARFTEEEKFILRKANGEIKEEEEEEG